MKKLILSISIIYLSGFLYSQVQTIDFEDLTLESDTFWNGSDLSGEFESGGFYFQNNYDTTYQYWSSGWAYSNRTDSTTQASDYSSQLYNAKPGSGNQGSEYYLVGQLGSDFNFTMPAIYGYEINGFYITNTTYAYNSMALGDNFAKKFGGADGNDPDYFSVVIKNTSNTNDSVEFYLADYRFSDNDSDYIVKDWQYLDVSSLTESPSEQLTFYFRSSDLSPYGINTPTYFALDDLDIKTLSLSSSKIELEQQIEVYPMPVKDILTIRTNSQLSYKLYSFTGKLIDAGILNNNGTIEMNDYKSGIYHLRFENRAGVVVVKKVIKL